MTVDLFALKPYDTETIGTVIDQLMTNCDGDQVERFLDGLSEVPS
jgi:hypothetical protein